MNEADVTSQSILEQLIAGERTANELRKEAESLFKIGEPDPEIAKKMAGHLEEFYRLLPAAEATVEALRAAELALRAVKEADMDIEEAEDARAAAEASACAARDAALGKLVQADHASPDFSD